MNSLADLLRFSLILYLCFRFLIDFIKPVFHPLVGLGGIQMSCLNSLVYYATVLLKCSN